jgi:hypothetical protein
MQELPVLSSGALPQLAKEVSEGPRDFLNPVGVQCDPRQRVSQPTTSAADKQAAVGEIFTGMLPQCGPFLPAVMFIGAGMSALALAVVIWAATSRPLASRTPSAAWRYLRR